MPALGTTFPAACVVATLITACASTPDSSERRIERLDPALDLLVPSDARIEVLAEGFEWSEGPVWVRDGGYVLFSDIPHNVVHRWKGVSASSIRVRLSPMGSFSAAKMAAAFWYADSAGAAGSPAEFPSMRSR